MKRTILFTLLFLFFTPFLIAQSCQLATTHFSTQQQIDDIPINHPDCKEILGGVIISSGIDDPIINLNGFSQIESITGVLFIRDNPQQFSLAGLNSLKKVSGFFHLTNNDSLYHVDGLSNLDSVNLNIIIEGNDVLENLSGLSNLSFLGEGLTIRNNEMLLDLSGISNKEIDGELLVDQNNSLTSLSGLVNLNIHGNFRIVSNPSLNNLGAVENLIIEKYLVFDNNVQMQNLIGLENLTEIGGGLTISNNNNLTSLEGIDNLSQIGGNLSIYQNNLLSNLDGLENLSEIGGSLSITNNNILTNLDGIENIDPFSIKTTNAQNNNQDIYIQDNPMLAICSVQSICEAIVFAGATTSLSNNASGCNFVLEIGTECGITSTLDSCLLGSSIFTTQKEIDDFPTNYPSCTVLNGSLRIDDGFGNGDFDITNFDSLRQLISIDGDLVINNNLALIDLDGLHNLSKVGGDLFIGRNPITSMAGLEALDTVGTNFHISQNDSLASLVGLDQLSFIGSDLTIFTNRKLENFQGLNSLVHLGGLRVRHSFLENFTGLNNVTKIDGQFNIDSNDSLSSFQGLENLDSITYFFTIESNQNMEGLSGLENIKFIGGNFTISENNSLTSLDALANLTHIEGTNFTIKGNNKLSSLSGLDNIELADPNSVDFLLIQDCDSLSFCSVKSICDYLLMGGGTSNFLSNATGCNSFSEIVPLCDFTAVKNLDKKSFIKIFPNPSNGIFEIKMEGRAKGKISIFDVMGKIVFEENLKLSQTINLGASPKGIYFVLIQNEDDFFSQKIILK